MEFRSGESQAALSNFIYMRVCLAPGLLQTSPGMFENVQFPLNWLQSGSVQVQAVLHEPAPKH